MQKLPILFITESDDAHADLVESALKQRNLIPYRLNTDHILDHPNHCYTSGSSMKCSWLPEGIETVWHRSRTKVVRVGEDASTLFTSLETTGLIDSLLVRLQSARWVNRPDALMWARPKIAQLERAQQCGLVVPATVVSNDTEVLREFYFSHDGAVVAKPLSAQVIFLENESLVFGTRSVKEDDLSRLAVRSPCFMQERLRVECEIRVVAFGDELHSFRMYSKHPYDDLKRLELHEIVHEPYIMGEEIKDQLRCLMRSYGLAFAACDLVLTRSGDLVFLELNPNGQWLWLQRMTGYELLDPFINFLLA